MEFLAVHVLHFCGATSTSRYDDPDLVIGAINSLQWYVTHPPSVCPSATPVSLTCLLDLKDFMIRLIGCYCYYKQFTVVNSLPINIGVKLWLVLKVWDFVTVKPICQSSTLMVRMVSLFAVVLKNWLGHPQPATPIQTDNSTAFGLVKTYVHITFSMKPNLKSTGMRRKAWSEELFENIMSTKCTVDFMGEVSWFLGCKYEWENLEDGRLTVSVTQTAKTEDMIDTHGMTDCNPVASPYRKGYPIDTIPLDGLQPDDKKDLVEKYQSLVGGLLWLQRQTRPDISAVTYMLARYTHNPSAGHYDSARYVLAYLKGTMDRGIRYTQGGSPVCVNVAFPIRDGVYTDANWGPQDASHPKEGENQTVDIEDAQSLLGHVVMRMGGPVCWGCTRETETMSLSSCESEIYAANEGTKSILTVRNLLQDFDYLEAKRPSILYNDNRGTVDWTKGCSVSKKLRHVNMRELMVRLHQRLNNIDVQHIEGKRNIADILTKEEKDAMHYRSMAFTITTPRLLANWNYQNGDTVLPDGTIERPRTKYQLDNVDNNVDVDGLPLISEPSPLSPEQLPVPVTAGAARGVLAKLRCKASPLVYSISGRLYGYVE